jgi:hypothetical protein
MLSVATLKIMNCSCKVKKQKVKQSHCMPWRRLEGEEEKLLLILDFGTRWG